MFAKLTQFMGKKSEPRNNEYREEKHEECRKNPVDAIGIKFSEGERILIQLFIDDARDEKSREHKEQFSSCVSRRKCLMRKDMKENTDDQGNSAESIKVSPVLQRTQEKSLILQTAQTAS